MLYACAIILFTIFFMKKEKRVQKAVNHVFSKTVAIADKLFFNRELRSQIEPEMLQLVHQNRLNFLVEGSVFKHKVVSYIRYVPKHTSL